MAMPDALPRIRELAPYSPGLSMDEIRAKYGLEEVIKLASNENPLGAPPLAVDAMRGFAPCAFRYPRGGTPRLLKAIAQWHGVDENRIAAGNGSDEIIDLLIRILAEPGKHNILCFQPCFSIYPIQAEIAGLEIRRQPLNADFSFDFDSLLQLADANTRLVFITTPDNPSGYCPPLEKVASFAEELAAKAPQALLFIDEAYMDFTRDEKKFSLLANHILPPNAGFCRTFSKSWGLAGLRLGYAVLPSSIQDAFWRARLPFSVGILTEEAALAALRDMAFRKATLEAVALGRERLANGLAKLGCRACPSEANFIMFKLPAGSIKALECFEALLKKGIIIRALKSYGLPDFLRVSVGNERENEAFLKALAEVLEEGRGQG